MFKSYAKEVVRISCLKIWGLHIGFSEKTLKIHVEKVLWTLAPVLRAIQGIFSRGKRFNVIGRVFWKASSYL